MTLTWKDIATAVLALLVAGLFFVKTNSGISLPLITDGYRWAILSVAVIEIVMCGLAGSGTNSVHGANQFMFISRVLGGIALILVIFGLLSGAKIAFILLAGTVLLLWLVSTLRHILGV